MKYHLIFLKKDEDVFMKVVCCSCDWRCRCARLCFSAIFTQKKVSHDILFASLGHKTLSKMGWTLKGVSLLLEEQIIFLKSCLPLRMESKVKI